MDKKKIKWKKGVGALKNITTGKTNGKKRQKKGQEKKGNPAYYHGGKTTL